MRPTSEDIKDILESSAVGLGTFATDLYVGQMPESPDECIAVFDTGGEEPMSNYVYLKPSVQVQVRNLPGKYKEGYELAQLVRNALHGVNNETISGTRYIGIWAQGDVLFLGWDDRVRPVFTINFRVHRTE